MENLQVDFLLIFLEILVLIVCFNQESFFWIVWCGFYEVSFVHFYRLSFHFDGFHWIFEGFHRKVLLDWNVGPFLFATFISEVLSLQILYEINSWKKFLIVTSKSDPKNGFSSDGKNCEFQCILFIIGRKNANQRPNFTFSFMTS